MGQYNLKQLAEKSDEKLISLRNNYAMTLRKIRAEIRRRKQNKEV